MESKIYAGAVKYFRRSDTDDSIETLESNDSSNANEDSDLSDLEKEEMPSLETFHQRIISRHEDHIPSKQAKSEKSIIAIPTSHKNRFNFASFDAGAMVIEQSPNAQDAHNILSKSRSKYMLMPCSDAKHFTVQLAEDIIVDTVTLANFEHYSSNFRQVFIYGSQKYPTTKWTPIRSYEFEDVRTEHVISVNQTWARYVKVNITSHYGNQYWCPVSRLQVFGTKMLEHFQEEMHGSEKNLQELQKIIAQEAGTREESLVLTEQDFTRIRDFRWFFQDLEEQCAPLTNNISDDDETDTGDTETTQESIFTTLTKRITRLETNVSISSIYVENVLKPTLMDLKDKTDSKLKALEQKFINLTKTNFTQEDLPESFHRMEKLFRTDSFATQIENMLDQEVRIQELDSRLGALEANMFYGVSFAFLILVLLLFDLIMRICSCCCTCSPNVQKIHITTSPPANHVYNPVGGGPREFENTVWDNDRIGHESKNGKGILQSCLLPFGMIALSIYFLLV